MTTQKEDFEKTINMEKIVLSILSVLVTISLTLSAYVFSTMERRIEVLEVKINDRIERIAILEQQSKENTAAHMRIETKVDTLISLSTNSDRRK